MGLFAKDFYRSLLLGFALGTVGMGVSIAAQVHAKEAAQPASVVASQTATTPR
ncbi:hypothetical protein OLX02_05135 [Novosphingobium sp. KCTC 2891]|uniref:hypothetical protein n=1 Tax=Novosphingobium sp. KCTC 2891 TaxID=2989730 RepID=UPI0022218FA0|nr:hypothetical protein [Novosphingobium sp. KCTC 2891]MCW1382198.1 hypothetical protein [Novosphingobium sp. KCTC 2891]